MKKNKLFKLENNQGTKQVLITMKKNRLFKQENNESTKQVLITMKKKSYSKKKIIKVQRGMIKLHARSFQIL